MGQLTENFVLDMLTACERKEHPPLTVWEAQQLLHAWREREALRKDAERYRWLRAHIPGGTYQVMGVIYSEGGAGVDAAIDAVMAGQG